MKLHFKSGGSTSSKLAVPTADSPIAARVYASSNEGSSRDSPPSPHPESEVDDTVMLVVMNLSLNSHQWMEIDADGLTELVGAETHQEGMDEVFGNQDPDDSW